MTTILFVGLMFTNLLSNDDLVFGKYISMNPNYDIQFKIDESGINDFFIDNEMVEVLNYDYLGQFGSSMLIQIKAKNKDDMDVVLKLLIVLNEEEFVLASGYIVKSNLENNGSLEILRKSAIELFLVK